MLSQGLLKQTTAAFHLTGIHLMAVRTLQQVALGQLPRRGSNTGSEVDGELLGWPASIVVVCLGGGLNPCRGRWYVCGHNHPGAGCRRSPCPACGLQPLGSEIVVDAGCGVASVAGWRRRGARRVAVSRAAGVVATSHDDGRWCRGRRAGASRARAIWATWAITCVSAVDGSVVTKGEQGVPSTGAQPANGTQHPHGQLADLVQAAVCHHHSPDDGNSHQNQRRRPDTQQSGERCRQQRPHIATRRREFIGGCTQTGPTSDQMHQAGAGKGQQHATHHRTQRRRLLVGPPTQQQYPTHHHHRRDDIGQQPHHHQQQPRQTTAQGSGQIAIQPKTGHGSGHGDSHTEDITAMTTEGVANRALHGVGCATGRRPGRRRHCRGAAG